MKVVSRFSAVGLVILVACACPNIRAQGPSPSADVFPARPIRWIVPYPPGGSPDVVARIVGQRLGERLKQPVLIDNRPGAFGNIGMEAAARSIPDGYTILLGIPTVVVNPLLHTLGFDPLTELTAVTQLTVVTFVLLANKDFQPQTVSEVLTAARARPGTVTCGWAGPTPRLACELLRIQGQAAITAIPYKGNAISDLVGGRIDLLFEVVNTALPQVKANRARAIATTNPKRGVGPFGELPTVNETLPGFEFVTWQGVLAPTGTPREIIYRLNREIAAVLEEDNVRKRLTDGGLEIEYGPPEAFAEIIRRDYAKFSRIVRDAGITPE